MMNADEITVIIEDSKDKVTITGSCDMCGKCCRPPAFCHPDFLINYTEPKPGTRISDGHCRYLTEVQLDGRQLCKIFIAEADGKLDAFPKEHVDYWRRCCKDWPTYDGLIATRTLKILISEGCFENCTFVPTLEAKTE